MNPYYMRAVDQQDILTIGLDLGLLALDEETGEAVAADNRVVWDVIGTLYEPTGAVDEEGSPVMAPVVDENGNTYWHANLYLTEGTLLEWAQGKHAEAQADGDTDLAEKIAAHIAASSKYFPLDEQGSPRYPNHPRRVLWVDDA